MWRLARLERSASSISVRVGRRNPLILPSMTHHLVFGSSGEGTSNGRYFYRNRPGSPMSFRFHYVGISIDSTHLPSLLQYLGLQLGGLFVQPGVPDGADLPVVC